ncbi:hypothetical protein C8J56DRAFT_448917 [Mycena floridula]|nr:hypothetical protein C8J56DRAFT_448917 [Mycena floridula]
MASSGRIMSTSRSCQSLGRSGETLSSEDLTKLSRRRAHLFLRSYSAPSALDDISSNDSYCPPTSALPPIPVHDDSSLINSTGPSFQSRSTLNLLANFPSPPSPELSHELRYPPINARKTRRHCSDFGLDRSKNQPPRPLHVKTSIPSDNVSVLSSGSTPRGTYTGTGSDDSSSIPDVEFDFPDPPAANPIIRRIKSSPSFHGDDTASVQSILGSKLDADFGRRAVGRPFSHTRDAPPSSYRTDDSPSSASFYSSEIDGPSKGLDLEMEGEQLLQMGMDNQVGRNRRYGFQRECVFSSEDTIIYSTPRPPSQMIRHSRQRSSVYGESQMGHYYSQPVSRVPASFQDSSFRRGVPKMRSLRFAPGCAESLDRLQVSIEKLKGPKSLLRGRSVSMEFQSKTPNAFADSTRSGFCPSLADSSSHSGRRRHRANLSVPLAALSTPFLHHNQPRVAEDFSNLPPFKSFIDITPENHNRPSSRRKQLRKLLARASSGVTLRWTKLFDKASTSRPT